MSWLLKISRGRERKKMKTFIIVLLVTSLSFAQEETPPVWSGAISLGSLFTSGNTDIKQIDSGLELFRELAGPSFVAGLEATASYGSQDETTYREKYLTAGSLRYDISENYFVFSRTYWTKDELAGIEKEYGSSAGFGRMLVQNDTFEIALDTGAGYFSRENTADSLLETSFFHTGLNMGINLSDFWMITESARFYGDFQDSDNYLFENTFEANSSITGSLSFVMGYDLSYYNLPPIEGNEKADTALRLQLRYTL